MYAGAGTVRVETAEGCWVVPPLRGVWIPPRTNHRVVMLGSVQMRTLYLRPDAAPNLPSTCCLVEVRPLLRELIFGLLDEPMDYDREGRGGLIAALILQELRFIRPSALHLPMPADARLQKLCQYLIAHPNSQDTLETLADRCAVSARTLARQFLSETGMSFSQWRQQAKLIEALGLLSRKLPITLVADRLGYASPSAFTAMFKRALGVEPSRYFDGNAGRSN